MSAVAAGFAEPVLAAQTTFRTVMDAMARPGTIGRLAGVAAPDPVEADDRRVARRRLEFNVAECLMIEPAQPPANPLRNPAVAFIIDCNFVRFGPRVE